MYNFMFGHILTISLLSVLLATLQKYDTSASFVCATFIAAGAMCVCMYLTDVSHPQMTSAYALRVATCAVTIVVLNVMYSITLSMYPIHTVVVSQTALTILLSTIVACLLFGEQVYTQQIFGMILIVVGIVFVCTTT